MTTTLQRGFTLIELLVVIAIIGTLSSIVLSSLSTARGKSTDAAIKQEIQSMPTALELQRIEGFPDKYEFGTACSSTPSTSDSGALFRDAISKVQDKSLGGVCAVYYEPYPPFVLSGGVPASGLVNSAYTLNSSGVLVHTGGVPALPGQKSYWAAAVKLSTGQYFCIDEFNIPTTTPTLTVGSGDYTC